MSNQRDGRIADKRKALVCALREWLPIERVVYIALILSLLVYWLITRPPAKPFSWITPAQLDALKTKLRQYRDEHIGPPNYGAYAEVFGSRVPPGGGERDTAVYDYEASPARAVSWLTPGSIERVPELRSMLEAYYEKTEHQWRLVGEAIKGGSCSVEGPALLPQRDLVRALLPIFASDNAMKGQLLVAQGKPEEAIGVFSMGIRLGLRTLDGFQGEGTIVVSCRGYDDLLWHPIKPETARLALERLRSLKTLAQNQIQWITANDTLGLVTRQISWMHLPVEHDDLYFARFFSQVGPYSVLAQLERVGLTRPENRRWLRRMSRIHRKLQQKLEGKSLGMGRPPVLAMGHDGWLIRRVILTSQQPLGIYTAKITTKPAVRKRLRRILETEPHLQTKHPIFSDKEPRSLPPELEVVLRAAVLPASRQPAVEAGDLSFAPDPAGSWYRWMGMSEYFRFHATSWLELEEAALAARLFRHEKGRWPEDVGELRAADLISTPVSHFPGPLTIVDFYSKYEKSPEDVDEFIVKRILESIPVVIWQPLLTRKTPDGNTVIGLRAQGVSRSWLKVATTGLESYAPLIQHVRITKSVVSDRTVSGAVLGQTQITLRKGFPFPPADDPILSEAIIEAQFHRPKHFWWVYSWGPDGKDDGGIVLAVAPEGQWWTGGDGASLWQPRGATGRGDIGQLVGWE